MIYNSEVKLLEDVEWLLKNILETQFSAYKEKYATLNVMVRIIDDPIGNGFLVWFYTGKEVKCDILVTKNMEFDLELHVHEALCQLLDFHT
jgi:hypothetical protein